MTRALRLDPPPGLLVRVVVALLRLIWRPRPRPQKLPQRFLLVRPDRRVGNLLITTSLVKSLRQHIPGAHVGMVVPQDRAEMLSGLAEVDVFHPFNQRDWVRPWRLIGWSRRVRAVGYDVVIDASHWHSHSMTAGILCRLAGGAWVVTAAGPGPKLSDHSVPLDLPQDGRWPSELRMKTRLLSAIGIEEDEPAMLCPLGRDEALQADAESWWKQKAGERKRVLLWLTTRKDTTILDAERWRRALDALPELQQGVIALGWGPGDEARLEEAEAGLLAAGYRVVAMPATSLDALAAYMLKADLVLSGDTGPLHLARALGRPIVAFFRADDGSRWCPTDPKVRRFCFTNGSLEEQRDH